MILLTALSAMTVGMTMQNAMPAFADRYNLAFSVDVTYGVLLFANGIGGVVGGLLLEASGKVPATVRTATFSAMMLGVSTIVFAITGWLVLAVIALIIGGFARITSESTEMSIVQLEAPEGER